MKAKEGAAPAQKEGETAAAAPTTPTDGEEATTSPSSITFSSSVPDIAVDSRRAAREVKRKRSTSGGGGAPAPPDTFDSPSSSDASDLDWAEEEEETHEQDGTRDEPVTDASSRVGAFSGGITWGTSMADDARCDGGCRGCVWGMVAVRGRACYNRRCRTSSRFSRTGRWRYGCWAATTTGSASPASTGNVGGFPIAPVLWTCRMTDLVMGLTPWRLACSRLMPRGIRVAMIATATLTVMFFNALLYDLAFPDRVRPTPPARREHHQTTANNKAEHGNTWHRGLQAQS